MNITKFELNQTMTLKEITDLLEVRHNDAMAVVERMSKEDGFGTATKISYPITSGKGRKQLIETYQLNKRQSIAVAARLNTNLLMRIIDRWQALEDAIIKSTIKGTIGWKQARVEGKVSRRSLTDVIKEFVAYSEAQGSRSAKMYYTNITRGTYKALYMLEKAGDYKELREKLSTMQLNQLATAEAIAMKAIDEHMDMGTHYKDIYKIAIAKVIELSDLLGKQLPGEDKKVLKIRTKSND